MPETAAPRRRFGSEADWRMVTQLGRPARLTRRRNDSDGTYSIDDTGSRSDPIDAPRNGRRGNSGAIALPNWYGAAGVAIFIHREAVAVRIAIVSPLFESVPPTLYGGTERVVSYLTEELVRQNHQVTLFASGDSRTRANLRPVTRRGLRLDPDCQDTLAYHVIMLDQVIECAEEFDIIHFNIDYWHFPLMKWLRLPAVTTLHGRLDLPDLAPLYARFRDTPLVSISDAQRKPLPSANWVATVQHGLPPDLFTFRERLGTYLAFLGRISPEKRPDRAIDIARRAGIPLRMAAKIDRVDQPYFEQQIRPLLAGPGVEFIGEITDADKNRFLGEALALLFPIDWPEPFGLAMVEAMACGTPTIAYRCGSVPEVMIDGVTGYIVNDEDDAVGAIGCLDKIARADCRRVFEQRYTAERMARNYVDVYKRVAQSDRRLVHVA